MTLMQSLQPQQNTRFVDVKPGSRVRYTTLDGTKQPFEAIVLEVKKDYGPHAIPAHMIRKDGGVDAELVMADGRTKVDILIDSQALQLSEPSPNEIRLRRIPTEAVAMQFTGGIENATEVIRFAAGKANISWRDNDSQNTEALLISASDGTTALSVGQYLVIEREVAHVIDANDFWDVYELDE